MNYELMAACMTKRAAQPSLLRALAYLLNPTLTTTFEDAEKEGRDEFYTGLGNALKNYSESSSDLQNAVPDLTGGEKAEPPEKDTKAAPETKDKETKEEQKKEASMHVLLAGAMNKKASPVATAAALMGGNPAVTGVIGSLASSPAVTIPLTAVGGFAAGSAAYNKLFGRRINKIYDDHLNAVNANAKAYREAELARRNKDTQAKQNVSATTSPAGK